MLLFVAYVTRDYCAVTFVHCRGNTFFMHNFFQVFEKKAYAVGLIGQVRFIIILVSTLWPCLLGIHIMTYSDKEDGYTTHGSCLRTEFL